MEKVETYNGDEKEIIKHGDGLDPEERIKYYEDVINDLYVVHGAFKRDLYMGENTLRKRLENEIKKIDEIINTNNKKTETKKEIKSEKAESMLIRENELLNNELANAHNALKKLIKIKFAKIDYSKFNPIEIQKYADSTRKKNQKLNYSKIAQKIGVSDHTTKNLCKFLQIN